MVISEDARSLKESLFIQSFVILEVVSTFFFFFSFVSGMSDWVDSNSLLGYLKLWFANKVQILECEYLYAWERENTCTVLCRITWGIIIIVARTISCHGFLALKEWFWIPFQHHAMLTPQTDHENNIPKISVILWWRYMRDFMKSRVQALPPLLILGERHRVFFLLSHFFTVWSNIYYN